MAGDPELEQLKRDVRYLMDRQAILDCICRHSRGHDRHDSALLASVYHRDGVDEKGWAINPAVEYPSWANAQHEMISQQHTHNITTHLCEIDGDSAQAESYVLLGLLSPDGASAQIISGRYIDRLEKRDGEWRIVLRRSTLDLLVAGDPSMLQDPNFQERGYVKGMRDGRDISYQRPVTLDETLAERW